MSSATRALSAVMFLLSACAEGERQLLQAGEPGTPDAANADLGAGDAPLPIPTADDRRSQAPADGGPNTTADADPPAPPPPDGDQPDTGSEGDVRPPKPDAFSGTADEGSSPIPGPDPDVRDPALDAAPDGAAPDAATPDATPPDLGPPPLECAPGESRECPACPGVRQICADGHWSACRGPAEVCNAADDDCDGQTDEGPDGAPLSIVCYDGPPLTGGQGECRAGIAVCDGGEYNEPCIGQVLPADEVCDGRDNDCDGFRDEAADGVALSNPCYEGPAETEGVGVCVAGTRLCQGGLPSACADQVLPTREICDGLDNDCNGQVDDVSPAPGEGAEGGSCDCVPGTEAECYGGPAGTDGVGDCRIGLQVCDDTGHFAACLDQVLPEPERCDGQDNDCNGAADDAIEGVGTPCELGAGACAVMGRVACDPAAGALVCDAQVPVPGIETCNDQDDDCDGSTDEDFPLGQACSEGIGECAVEGVLQCSADEGVVCGARPRNPGLEVCDGLDNDCDGQADDGLDLGAPCSVGVGACEARGQRVCAPDGTVACSVAPLPPASERCNGTDDDCDGEVDEADPQLGADCGTGLPGICGTGQLHCPDGVLRCAQTVQPEAEACDGLDQDCDGRADNAPDGSPLVRVCYNGPPGTSGVGLCTGGRQICAQGVYGACDGQVVPAAEVCDGRDNDCNGTPDDLAAGSCRCQPGATQPCYGGPAGTAGVGVCQAGMQTCIADGTGYGACQGEVLPQAERCNTLDDDCNGTPDDPPGAGGACENGVGACARPGRFACDPVGGGLVCDAMAGAATPERCDQIDNDCNARVDDVQDAGAFCRAANPQGGACRPEGRLTCTGSVDGSLVCAPVANPQRERCNGIDDDNDLCVDEEIVEVVGEVCTVGVGACQRAGVTACLGAAGVACNVSAGSASPEVCDNRDNDCDGRVDDEPTDAGRVCSAGVGACRREGVSTCSAGTLGCTAAAGSPEAERCDQLDNDCDGQTDEGGACDVFASCAAARAAGRQQSGVQRLQPPGAPAAVNVYCDQVVDGGGWTLVGSSRDGTLNDQASAWYADLQTLAPAGANLGLWSGLRSLGGLWDVRFACRDNLGAVDSPMTVDLSFYDVSWYWEFTAGTDAQSCFSENEGAGDDQPTPARRNNVSGSFLLSGIPWFAINLAFFGDTYLEGEDACTDTGDFTVDFSDRGIDSEESDGTDWGEDDTVPKCGRRGVASGQWFVFAREKAGTFPGCPVEDAFEENDTPGTATPLVFANNNAQASGGVCGTESDWFAFDGRAGCTYNVTVSLVHANGDLDTTMQDGDGVQVDSAGGVGNQETMSYVVPVGEPTRLSVRVYGFGFNAGRSNTYTVAVTQVCPP